MFSSPTSPTLEQNSSPAHCASCFVARRRTSWHSECRLLTAQTLIPWIIESGPYCYNSGSISSTSERWVEECLVYSCSSIWQTVALIKRFSGDLSWGHELRPELHTLNIWHIIIILRCCYIHFLLYLYDCSFKRLRRKRWRLSLHYVECGVQLRRRYTWIFHERVIILMTLFHIHWSTCASIIIPIYLEYANNVWNSRAI